MSAYRCSICALNYPYTTDYAYCLNCDEPTDPIRNAKPMPKDELQALKRGEHREGDDGDLSPIGEQWLVTAQKLDGQNPNGETRTEVFYSTHYSAEEAHDAARALRRRLGDECGAKAILASGRPPKDGQPVAEQFNA